MYRVGTTSYIAFWFFVLVTDQLLSGRAPFFANANENPFQYLANSTNENLILPLAAKPTSLQTAFPSHVLDPVNTTTSEIDASTPTCDGTLFGSGLNYASCNQAFLAIPLNLALKSIGLRGLGLYDYFLPFRLLSSRCRSTIISRFSDQ